MTMVEVEKMYWWRRSPNFGDAIAPEIVSWISGKNVTRAEEGCSDVLLSVGSILHLTDKFENTVVWGTGIDPHYAKPQKNNYTLLALRGPLTRDLLKCDTKVLGDPGILLPRVYEKEHRPVDGKIGIVLHHRTFLKRKRDTILFNPFRTSYAVIDPRRHWKEVVDDIASCEFVFCQSLHGAIVAQSYGIPWAWWKGFHGRVAWFKWHDWFASLGIEPRDFRLSQYSRARLWNEKANCKTPSADALVNVFKENVRITE